MRAEGRPRHAPDRFSLATETTKMAPAVLRTTLENVDQPPIRALPTERGDDDDVGRRGEPCSVRIDDRG